MKDDIPLDSKIREYIEKTGYPTELAAGELLAASGRRDLWHNVYYLDEDENKGREIDVVSVGSYMESPRAYVEHHMICSVKKSTKPWIVYSNALDILAGDPGWYRLVIADKIDNAILPYEKLVEQSTIRGFERYGHAYDVAFTEQRHRDIRCTVLLREGF